MITLFKKDEIFSAYNDGIEIHFKDDFSCSEDEVVLFIGPNGIGKSTLAKIFTNFINYRVIKGTKNSRKMLFHPQELIFLPGNVCDDYDVFLKSKDFDYEDKIREIDIDESKSLSNFYNEHKNKSVNSLSGGEKQLILILRTLLAYEKWVKVDKQDIAGIIFDEPSKQLCSKNFQRLKSVFLDKFSHVKLPLFFITHEFNLVHAIFQIFLKEGKTISFIEIKESGYKIKEVSCIGRFNKDDIEEKWENIIAKSEYLKAFFEHREHESLYSESSSLDLGKVVISYPFHSGLYKVVANKDGAEYEFLSLKPKNSNTILKKEEIILEFKVIK
jgi:ABC-type multidrug transport system ATPase subunit